MQKKTWFKQRMDELGLTYEDVAKATDRDVNTIRTWEHRGYIPYQPHNLADWQPLLDVLKMSMLEAIVAMGHDVQTHYDLEQHNLLHRLNKLPANQQAHCVRMIEAVLTVCEDFLSDDL